MNDFETNLYLLYPCVFNIYISFSLPLLDFWSLIFVWYFSVTIGMDVVSSGIISFLDLFKLFLFGDDKILLKILILL